MDGATIEELRELSRRSRATQGAGFLALGAGLLGVLLAAMAAPLLDYAAVILTGGAFVTYAFAAGKERGAFRRVFRRLATERKRTLEVQDVQKKSEMVAPRAP